LILCFRLNEWSFGLRCSL